MPVIQIRDIVVKYDRLSKIGRIAIWWNRYGLFVMLGLGLVWDGMIVWFLFFRN